MLKLSSVSNVVQPNLLKVERIFLGFAGRPRDFLGIDSFPHSIIFVTLNPEYPPGYLLSC